MFYTFPEQKENSATDKCIILDLDETLVHSFEFNSANNDLLKSPEFLDLRQRLYFISLSDISRLGSGDNESMWGIFRPGTREFLKFASEYFKYVCVWSAGKFEYVYEICKVLFRGLKKPTLIYTFDDCSQYENHLIKPISKVFNDPRLNGEVGYHNTLILDDRNSTFIKNIDNGVLIPVYMPDKNIEGLRGKDERLLEFMKWLSEDKIKNSPNVNRLRKDNIFTVKV